MLISLLLLIVIKLYKKDLFKIINYLKKNWQKIWQKIKQILDNDQEGFYFILLFPIVLIAFIIKLITNIVFFIKKCYNKIVARRNKTQRFRKI